MLPRLRRGNLTQELLVRASKVKSPNGAPTVIDATAGFAEDSLLLAAAGFSVKLYERNPVIAALLRDALTRALEIPELSAAASRMELTEADSLTALPRLETRPDVVYLDPMFPEKAKSALAKKKFQLLHQLELPCEDEEALLRAAISASPRRIVIKRPLKGKAIRYDCILLPNREK